MNDIGVRIKRLREEKGITQEAMAMDLELSQSNYGRLEKDDSRLTAPKLIKIADILKVSVSYLFNESNAKIINQHNNQNPSAYNVEHFYNQNQEIYNSLINQMRDEISFLRAQLVAPK